MGWVINDTAGVQLYLEATESEISSALAFILSDLPKAARISSVDRTWVPSTNEQTFSILASNELGARTTEISVDLAMCADCEQEVLDPANRRYKYPYINCTNCGPRYSVVNSLPYDRENTTMAPWKMCGECKDEYQDPLNRRFHAEPIACWNCGPRYRLFRGKASTEFGSGYFDEIPTDDEPIRAIMLAAQALREGKIVGIKGIGGYHLACDANNPVAVAALRSRKFRREKAFAVMAKSLGAIEEIAHLNDDEREMLCSPQAPILLVLSKRSLEGVAPTMVRIGVMLPYTPAQRLLFEEGSPEILVMTSGNRSSEPIYHTDEEALSNLVELADYILVGERPIRRRLDDSVVVVVRKASSAILSSEAPNFVILRRSRGYSPSMVAEIPASTTVLGCGADLKSTVALLVAKKAFISPYLGDLAYLEVQNSHREVVSDFMDIYQIDSHEAVIAADLHPEYHSTKLADRYAEVFGFHEVVHVQHHKAHVASVLAEVGLFDERVVGVAMDGTGYGEDGSIWGGEFFVGSLLEGLSRVTSLVPGWLLGGEGASRRPLQSLAGFLVAEEEWQSVRRLVPGSEFSQYEMITRLRESRINTLVTTSAGRLFDAVAAICGFSAAMTYEGQAAMWLEGIASRYWSDVATQRGSGYPHSLDYSGRLSSQEMLSQALKERLEGRAVGEIALEFHLGFASGIADVVGRLCASQGTQVSVLSGGVFQNQLLRGAVATDLQERGLRAYFNKNVSCNDEGISLGQLAYVALAPRGFTH